MWFGARKQKCAVTSIYSHIRNMVRGVTEGYKFKMRSAANHFPINLFVTPDKKTIEIKNFIGERLVRKIQAKEGVSIVKDDKETNQFHVQGTSLENVS